MQLFAVVASLVVAAFTFLKLLKKQQESDCPA